MERVRDKRAKKKFHFVIIVVAVVPTRIFVEICSCAGWNGDFFQLIILLCYSICGDDFFFCMLPLVMVTWWWVGTNEIKQIKNSE